MNIKANPNPTNSEMDSKTIIKHPTLTSNQREDLIEQFVDIVVDGMDMKTLVSIVSDNMMDYYADCSDIELKELIDDYDEEMYDELVENVTYDATKDAASYT